MSTRRRVFLRQMRNEETCMQSVLSHFHARARRALSLNLKLTTGNKHREMKGVIGSHCTRSLASRRLHIVAFSISLGARAQLKERQASEHLSSPDSRIISGTKLCLLGALEVATAAHCVSVVVLISLRARNMQAYKRQHLICARNTFAVQID